MKFYLLQNNMECKSDINGLFIIENENEYYLIAEGGKYINYYTKEQMAKTQMLGTYFKKEIELFEVFLTIDMEEIEKNILNACVLVNNQKALEKSEKIKQKIIRLIKE